MLLKDVHERPRIAHFLHLNSKKKKWRKKRKKKNLSPPFIYFFSCPLSLFLPFLYCGPFVDHLHWKRGKKKKKGANPRKRWKIKYRRLTMYTPCHTVLHPTRKQCLCLACALQCRTLLHIYTSTYPLIDVSIHASRYVTTCLLVHPISLLIERPLPWGGGVNKTLVSAVRSRSLENTLQELQVLGVQSRFFFFTSRNGSAKRNECAPPPNRHHGLWPGNSLAMYIGLGTLCAVSV